jgi:GINS complex subunit 2
LIEDIRDVRFHKVESGLETLSGRTHAVKVSFCPPLLATE